MAGNALPNLSKEMIHCLNTVSVHAKFLPCRHYFKTPSLASFSWWVLEPLPIPGCQNIPWQNNQSLCFPPRVHWVVALGWLLHEMLLTQPTTKADLDTMQLARLVSLRGQRAHPVRLQMSFLLTAPAHCPEPTIALESCMAKRPCPGRRSPRSSQS